MRHIRTRRRFRLILILLFTLCLTLLVESRIEAFLPELKSVAEIRIEQALGGKLKLSIGSVDGGIFSPIVLNEITIKERRGATGILQSLAINNIRTNYRVWDALVNAKDGSMMPDLLEKGSSVYVNFSLKDRSITGFIGIEGDLLSSKFNGYVILFGRDKVDFTGSIKDDRFDIELRPKTGSLRAAGKISDNGEIVTDLKIRHLKMRGFDVLCDAVLKNRIIADEAGSKSSRIEGEIETKGLILNFKPFPDLKASYTMSDGILTIPGLSIGDVFRVYGKARLSKPAAVDMTLTVNNVSLSWLMLTLRAKEATSVVSGTMSGKFEFKGPANKMKISSHFDIRNGTLATLDFDYLAATIKGEFPFVKIEYSRVNRKSGYFSLSGEMDLRRAGRDNIFDDIKLVTDDGAISWDDWRSTKVQDVHEYSMRKNITDDVGVSFKKFVAEDRIDESLRDRDEVRLEYKLDSNDSLKVMMGQDQDFFGFEHRDKF